jgi:acyl carrier protein
MNGDPGASGRIVLTHIREFLPLASPEDLTVSDLFYLGLDSNTAVALLLRLEEVFGIEFEMGEISYENFRTAAAITRLVEEKRDGMNGAGDGRAVP